MKNNTSIIFKFGALAGIIIASVMLIGAVMVDPSNPNLTAGFIIGTSSMLVAFLLLIPALKRINASAKQSFLKNLLFCLAIVLIATIIYSLAWTIYIIYIDPEMVKSIETYFLNDLGNKELSADALAEARDEILRMTARYRNPGQTFLWTLIEPSPSGVLMTLIASFVQLFKNRKSA